MELLVDIEISVLGGDVAVGNWYNLILQTQVIHLYTHACCVLAVSLIYISLLDQDHPPC